VRAGTDAKDLGVDWSLSMPVLVGPALLRITK